MTNTQGTAGDIARVVAPLLAIGEWSYVIPAEDDPRGWHAAIVRKADGAEISINTASHKGRLFVHGQYPRWNGHYYGPAYGSKAKAFEISIAIGRPAEAIAREINRRFLPVYLPAYEQACKERARDVAAHGAADDLANAIANELGQTATLRANGGSGWCIFACHDNPLSFTINVDTIGNARVTLDSRERATLVRLSHWLRLHAAERIA